MNTNGTAEKSDFDEVISALKTSLNKNRASAAAAKEKEAYPRLLHEVGLLVNSKDCPIAGCDVEFFQSGTLIHDLETMLADFVGQMNKQKLKTTLESLPLERRFIEWSNPEYDNQHNQDERHPGEFVCVIEDNPAVENVRDYWLATPTLGWKISTKIGNKQLEFTMYATVGFPFAEKVKKQDLTHLFRIPKGEQYPAFPRFVVFFTGVRFHQYYATSVEEVKLWLRQWLRRMTPAKNV